MSQNVKQINNPHTLTTKDVIKKLHTDPIKGLDNKVVIKNQQRFGINQLIEKKPESILKKFIKQFKDVMIIILLISALIAFVPIVYKKVVNQDIEAAEWAQPFIILGVVIINAIIGTIQETKANQAITALKQLTVNKTRVIRNGEIILIDSKELTIGDVLFFEAGDSIYADARIIDANNLQTIEGTLTGESLPVIKNENKVYSLSTKVADQANMVFAGTYVATGSGKAIVTAIGMNTQLGQVAKLLNETKVEKTPLQKQISKFGKWLSILCIAICLLVLVIEFIHLAFFGDKKIGFDNSIAAIMLAVSLAVAAIPEGLPIVITINMSIGVTRMAKQHAIVKNLLAVEVLGSAAVICTDKTGTLTMNQMTLEHLYDLKSNQEINLKNKVNNKTINNLLTLSSLCTNASIYYQNNKLITNGDPTEIALIQAYEKHLKQDQTDLINKFKRIEEIPFDSKRKLMSVIINQNKHQTVITKGAFDQLIKVCHCSQQEVKLLNKINEKYSSQGYRVLGLATKKLKPNNKNFKPSFIENNLTFVGLLIMIDPPRKEVKKSILEAKQAGINVVMITGDHVLTATSIAKQIGIYEKNSLAVDGITLSQMSDQELISKINKIKVFARVSPSDKLRIINAWKSLDQVVAMIGDGVNDAPALKATDIGCVMGTSTDVAKDASDIILQDDNFHTILKSVKQGRNIFNNIVRVIGFLIATNIAEIIIILGLIIAGFFLDIDQPLSAIQILWINLIGDSFPAIALSLEKPTNKVMLQKPRNAKLGIFANRLWLQVAYQSFTNAIITLAAYFIGYIVFSQTTNDQQNLINDAASTCAFITLGISQLSLTFNLRNNKSIFKTNFYSNQWLIIANALSLVLILLVTLIPSITNVFNMTTFYQSNHWYLYLVTISMGCLLPIIFSESYKFLRHYQ